MYKIVLSLIIASVVSGCASPYVGREVKMSHKSVCKSHTFPLECKVESDRLNIRYKVVALTGAGKYKITGEAVKPDGATKTWTDYTNAVFTLLLINNGVTVEAVNIYGGSGSLDKPITFSRTFETNNDFKAAILTYNMEVQG